LPTGSDYDGFKIPYGGRPIPSEVNIHSEIVVTADSHMPDSHAAASATPDLSTVNQIPTPFRNKKFS